jgi:hypothetical protein
MQSAKTIVFAAGGQQPRGLFSGWGYSSRV